MRTALPNVNLTTAVIACSILFSTASNTATAAQLPERTIAFEMRDKPWLGEKGVLEWLSDQTGLPVSISSAKPAGTLTFLSPHGEGGPRRYSLPEIIDMLNDELLKQKLILVRRAKIFTIEPADEKINPAALPQVLPRELEKYGNTELVSVLFPLRSLLAEEFAAEVKGMLGPFGSVTSLAQANKLVVQDTVANLKRIRAIVEDSQDAEKPPCTSLAHTCRYIPARHAERMLRELLGDPKELLRALQPQLQVNEGFAEQVGTLPAVLPHSLLRLYYLSVDDRTNTLLATGPADKMAQAEAILKKIDVPRHKDQEPLQVGPSLLKTYPVSGGHAEVLAKNLHEIYKSVPGIRFAVVDPHALMVWAGPNDQREILTHIRNAKPPDSTLEIIPLTSLDAAEAADTLKGLFGDAKSGAAYLKADPSRNALIARGTLDQLREIKFTLRALGEGSAPPPIASVRVLTIEQGTAATMTIAEALERMLPQYLQNPVQVIPSGSRELRTPGPRRSEPAQDKPNGKNAGNSSTRPEK